MGHAYRTQRRFRRKDGSLFWGELTSRLIDSDNLHEGSIWIVSDMSENLLAQQGPNEAHEQFTRQPQRGLRAITLLAKACNSSYQPYKAKAWQSHAASKATAINHRLQDG
ncbi:MULTISPECIES: PAS domain S-box protein [Comamonas]|uniref:PAC domain-containing protein n=2 Tax=Comamonas TaxID=283 RepID=A0A0E3C1T6_9BURK|nr:MULTISPECIES: PAS domain S-box protein [Comamonas]AIJ48503.1 hypothetical protein O987_22065 [Comamonas testosteroni TK102]KGG91605.1 hypothetical protein P245_13460 [Comamonas thiooxydans]KGH12864.1 hypothetical protein P608_09500 [Comamonas thiooxydans]KGH23965.1 hypothetical protein P606_09715 [Comamonas thiooxydans]KGH25593.1 hypothetical protein P607_05090 [Comamonas thiooxydans]